ncbi:MAG: hypothetical protein JJU03_00030 [Idiomarina sp.]|nr:hypothetical protein [Idiomarina sp.]
MQQLAPPYAFYPVPEGNNDPAHSATSELLTLLAPVTGESFAMAASPYAVDQLYLQGAGGWLRPRTQKLVAPARCKLLKISPCRCLWTFALSKSLRLYVQIKAAGELPYAHQQVKVGTLLRAGQTFATLSATVLKQHPMVLMTVQQVKSTTPLAISWQCGPLSAAEDPIIKVYRIPAYQAASDLSTTSSLISK